MNRSCLIATLVLLCTSWVLAADTADREHAGDRATVRPPNVLLIVADDLGIGDVGCFGNSTVRTPSVDRIAKEGVRFDAMYAAAAVCTPSRAALLTGRYPIRSGMVSDSERRVLILPSAPYGLPHEELTIAEVVQDKGYKTALFGKWHLGVNGETNDDGYYLPTRQGFESFWGLPYTNVQNCNSERSVFDVRFWISSIVGVVLSVALPLHLLRHRGVIGRCGTVTIVTLVLVLVTSGLLVFRHIVGNVAMCMIYRQNDIIEQPLQLENFTLRLVNEANSFIEERAAANEPFFLFFSMLKVHTALFASKQFRGVSEHGEFGDNIAEMDYAVGKLLEQLDRSGIADDTLVVFTSDNGPWLEERHEGGSNGKFKGGKGQNFEGGIRMPSVMRYPRRVRGDQVWTHTISQMDIFHTIADLVDYQLPNDRIFDGQSLVPLFTLDEAEAAADPSTVMSERVLVHYCAKYLTAVRVGAYKGFFVTPVWSDDASQTCGDNLARLCDCNKNVVHHDPPLIFNIEEDPGEERPLPITHELHPKLTERMKEIVREHKKELGSPPPSLSGHIPYPWLQPCCSGNKLSCECLKEPTDRFVEATLEEVRPYVSATARA